MQKKVKRKWLISYLIGLIAIYLLIIKKSGVSSDSFLGFVILIEFVYSVAFLTIMFVKQIAYPSEQVVDDNILNAPEEFKNILNYMEERNILDFGVIQKKIAIVTFLRRLTCIILLISAFIFISELAAIWEPLYVISTVSFIVSLVFLKIFEKLIKDDTNEFIYMYKKEVIPSLLNQMNRNLNYVPIDPEKIEEYEKLYEQSEFSRDFEYIRAEDFIEGHVVADITVRMADIVASKEGSEGENIKLFGGLFAHFKNVNYDNMKEISIRTEPDYGKLESLKVVTGNSGFDRYFVMYTSNEEAVRAMQLTGFFDAITELRLKHDCKFDIIIREGEIYIQIPLRNVFEPNLMDFTGGRKTLYKHYQNYKLFFDVFYLTRDFVEGSL